MRIGVIGGGPVGVECALRLRMLGHTVSVYEAGRIGQNVREWGHVRMFSPWSLNRSEAGSSLLRDAGVALADGEQFPSGADYVSAYLMPLVREMRGDVRMCEHTRVVSVARSGILKSEEIGGGARHGSEFRLLVEHEGNERNETADAVIDAGGVWSQANWAGIGGAPVPGERAMGERIERRVPDLGQCRERYAQKRVLVVGAGYSAITNLAGLLALRGEDAPTQLHWVTLTPNMPYQLIEDDPLPARAALAALGNTLAGDDARVVFHGGVGVSAFEERRDAVRVRVEPVCAEGVASEIVVDEVLSNTGFRPDTEVTRELQVHHCYATEGPMKQAAYLLAGSGDSADCLAQVAGGAAVLRNPEPDFYIVGAKSYGRSSAFLIRLGLEQVDALSELVGPG